MTIYFIMFSISFFAALIAEKNFNKKNKKIAIFFSILAIIIPSLLAAFRAEGIGTDTRTYIHWTFYFCKNSNDLLEAIRITDVHLNVEILYVFINFICSRFSNEINLVYFVIEVILLSFVYLACYYNGRKNFSISYFFFLILFFNKSLNMCRQSIAIAIILFAIKYAYEKKFNKYLIFCLIASGFHSSSIIMLLLYFYINFINNKKNEIIKNFFIIIILSFIVISYEKLILFLINNISLIDQKYLLYVGTTGNINKIELIFKVFMLILCFLLYTKKSNNKFYNDLYYFICFDLIIFLVGFEAGYAYRFSYYLYYFYIFLIPKLSNKFKTKRDKLLFLSFIILIGFVYSYIYYSVYNFDETVPYRVMSM